MRNVYTGIPVAFLLVQLTLLIIGTQILEKKISGLATRDNNTEVENQAQKEVADSVGTEESRQI